MILPIYLYGHPILRELCEDIPQDYPDLDKLVNNMFETMYNAEGIGLAGPQVGIDKRIFVVDLEPLAEDDAQYAGFKKVFINPQIVEYTGKNVKIEEGCLSIPGIHEPVEREDTIRIQYFDEKFVKHDEVYSDFFARCIQHEYDHIEGKLFIDKISPIRRQLIKKKLENMVKGKISTFYKTRSAKAKG